MRSKTQPASPFKGGEPVVHHERAARALERLGILCYDVAKPMKECGCQETVFTNSQVGTKIGGRPMHVLNQRAFTHHGCYLVWYLVWFLTLIPLSNPLLRYQVCIQIQDSARKNLSGEALPVLLPSFLKTVLVGYCITSMLLTLKR